MAGAEQGGGPGGRWERVAHVAFILACVTLTTIAILQYAKALSAPTAQPSDAAKEDTVTDVALGEPWEQRAGIRTILVYMSSTCPHCQRSTPFYVRLSAATGASAGRWRVLFTSLEQKDVIGKFLTSNGLSGGVVVAVPGGLPTRSTPLLVLVESGKVFKSWLGRLNQDQERKLMQLVTSSPE